MQRAVRHVLAPGFRWSLRRQERQLLSAAQECEQSQLKTLRRLLALNADTAFQQDFRLANVRQIREFQNALPIAGYERVLPYIERVQVGETKALLGEKNRLLMLAMTSGTTSESKFIPITKPFLRDYRRGWQLWGIRAFDDHPMLHHSEIFQLTSPWNLFASPAGIPCGHISGLVQQMQSRILRCMYAVPMYASQIRSPFEKLYFALKHSLCAPGLGMISTANPSTLCQMFRILEQSGEDLVRDLYEGKDLSQNQASLPLEYRQVRNRRRARELERILESTGTLRPSNVWPHLQLISVWTGGSAAAYLPLLREYLDGIPIRDHGLHASEGRITIPLEDESSSGLLDIQTHFFEFIPETEIHSPEPHVLLAHELIEDESYYVVMTTASGLYRYDIQDVVQCTGFLGSTPLLRFLHKGAHISNLTGEKLTESQVVGAVMNVARRLQLHLNHFTLTPQWGDPPRYLLIIDETRLSAVHPELDLSSEIERELLQANSEYREKRHSQRLAPLGLLTVPRPGWQQFIQYQQTQLGRSEEQYKHPYLIPKLDFLDQFQRQFLSDAAPSVPSSPLVP